MQKLVQGVHSFQTEIFGTQRALFERLSRGQNPIALFITCSDSRINPCLLTQTDPGELFILRNAGNIVPAHGGGRGGGEAATIEFAVAGLGVRDIVICGHSHCGAMQALVDPHASRDMPALQSWLEHAEATRRIVSEQYGHLVGPKLLTAAVEENVLVQLENLRTHPAVASALARRKLAVHGWVYKIETGEVFAYHPQEGQFLPLSEAALFPSPPPAGPDLKPSI